MTSSEIVIVGAGPHGLAVALHLLKAQPALRHRLTVLDPAGEWLTRWRDAFGRLHIDTLRSPGVHHPGTDPYGLLRFTERWGLAQSGHDYNLPAFSAFDAYCRRLIDRFGLGHDGGVVQRAQLHDLVATPTSVRLSTNAGELTARHVVVAANPHRRVLPDWLADVLPLVPSRLQHADDVDLRHTGETLRGQRVAVIGGGLTAAHLAVGAVARGATVHLLARRALAVRMFDVEPAWLGPRCLSPYLAEPDPHVRLRLAQEARGGGSIPPWMLQRLDALAATGALQINASGPLVGAGRDGEDVVFRCRDGQRVTVDRVWLATGTTSSLSAARYLSEAALDCPAAGDLPLLNDGLRLGPWPIHVTGRLATLGLGPAAGNLWGARQAALAITRHITGVEPAHGPRHSPAGR